MSDWKALDELGMALDPPGTVPPARLRHRVLTEAAQRRGRAGISLPRFALPRVGWRLAAVGGLASVLIAGILVTQVLPFGGQAPASSASAAQILQGAAAQAQGQPAVAVRGDQFIHVESITYTMSRSEGEGRNPNDTTFNRTQRQIWLSVDGTRDGLLRERPKSGAGDWVETALPACHHTKNGKQAQPPCVPVPAYQRDLPTDIDGMREYLYRGADGAENPRDQVAFTRAGDLIREAYLTPASLAAVFGAVAKIPGVTVVGDVTDEAGRAGVAVALTEVPGGTELIFDRQTHAYLGERQVQVQVQDQDGLRAGQVTNSTAVLKVAIVDQAGQLP